MRAIVCYACRARAEVLPPADEPAAPWQQTTVWRPFSEPEVDKIRDAVTRQKLLTMTDTVIAELVKGGVREHVWHCGCAVN